jgi:hypothetical protein
MQGCRNFRRGFVLTVVLGLSGSAQAQDSAPRGNKNSQAQSSKCTVAGQWHNDRGSGVNFTCGADGQLSGTYNTHLGAPDKGQSFPLTGWVEGDNLTFTVNFKGYGSITAWAGQIEEVGGEPQLKTLWHLTRDISEEQEPADMWASVTAGASVFTRAENAAEPN